jgi:ribosomal protein L17
MWIYEYQHWPNFTWDTEALAFKLADLRHRQGRLLGRMEALGFELKQEASLKTLTNDVITSSAIEGESLETEEVRSSIARHLGIAVAGLVPASRRVDGVVEMMLDATQGYSRPLTRERLFGWHATLFQTGRSGMHRISVGSWRTKDDDPMQVISGPMGRENSHFEAPGAERLNAEMAAFLAWFNQKTGLIQYLKRPLPIFGLSPFTLLRMVMDVWQERWVTWRLRVLTACRIAFTVSPAKLELNGKSITSNWNDSSAARRKSLTGLHGFWIALDGQYQTPKKHLATSSLKRSFGTRSTKTLSMKDNELLSTACWKMISRDISILPNMPG